MVLAAMLAVAWVARAAATHRSTVVLVLPEVPDSDLAEAYVRVQGELRAAGFEVKPTLGPRDSEPSRALTLAAEELQPAAVIGIFESPSGALEFWILDVRSGRTALKRMVRGGDAARAPEILAISAVELLLAGLSELDIKPAPDVAERPAAPPAPAASTSARGPEPRGSEDAEPRRWGLELGLATAASTDGAGVAWLPAARLEWAPLPVLRARLSGMGLGTHPEISGTGGSARTSQAMVLTEVVLRPWATWNVAPQLSLGSGAYYFGIEGQSTAAGVSGRAASRWSAAVDAGAGLSFELHHRLELLLEAHALLAQPYPSVQFLGTEQATAGRPTLIFSAMVAGWL